MTTTLRFREHAEFHRAAWQMAGAGALAGLVAHALFRGVPAAWAVAIVAFAAVLGAMAPRLRVDVRALGVRAGLVGVAAAALALLPRAGQPELGVIAFAGLFGLALGWGLSGRRLAVAVAIGAGGALLSRYVYGSVMTAHELAALPSWAVTGLAGAGFSFVSVLALLPRHVELHRDHVAEAYEGLSGLGGEIRELCDRGYALWIKASGQLPEGNADLSAIEGGVGRLFEVARRWSSVNAESAQAGTAALVDRMIALDERIAKTEDSIARAQYEQAKASLAEQLRYLEDIGTSRERVLARMHNYVAAMERLHLAVVNLESTSASTSATPAAALDDLETLGADIDSCVDALFEAESLAASV